MLSIIAAGALQMAPEARALFRLLAADLPAPTLLFQNETWAFLLLPMAAALAAGILFASTDGTGRVARYASASVIGLVVSANLALFGGLSSFYLPLFRCGSFVDTGYTRLHAAVLLGRDASALRQIAGGAPVNARDDNGSTPLHLAVSSGNLPLAEALLAGGATVNATDVRGGTPLDRAYGNKHARLAALLEGRGGTRSTKESRQLVVERAKTEVQAMATQGIRFGSCGAV